jgi:hypothetical protein
MAQANYVSENCLLEIFPPILRSFNDAHLTVQVRMKYDHEDGRNLEGSGSFLF